MREDREEAETATRDRVRRDRKSECCSKRLCARSEKAKVATRDRMQGDPRNHMREDCRKRMRVRRDCERRMECYLQKAVCEK